MSTVADIRKCRVQGCQRKPLFVAPSVDNITGEATHCAAHREEGFPLQEGFSLKDGFLLQNGVVVHNTYRGSSAYRNRVSSNANDDSEGGGGGGGSSGGGDSVPASTSRGGKQARGGKGKGGGGAGKGRGGSVAQRPSRSSTCQFPGCAKPATHGDGSTPTRCAAHKEKGQIDHKHRLCENVTPKPCLKQPSFGWPGESRKRFCGAHRRPGSVDLRNCEHEGCGTRASHGFGKGRARFCAAHSLPGTSVVANKPCEKEGCIVSPRFGYEGEKPRFCGSHKEKQMVNLKDRRCERHPCTTQPTFALPGEKPRFCSKHKSEGHVNVRHKLCRHPNCMLVPTYGTEGTRVPVACLGHSDGDMVDLKRARMRMSQANKATMPAAASRPNSRGKVAATGMGEAAPASPAVAGKVGAGAGTAPAAAVAAAVAEAEAEAAAVVTGKKRPRANATQSLGGNAGIGRKIAEAIFTSSQRVLEGEEAAATEESEWEEDEADASGEANDDDDDEDDDDDDAVEAEEKEEGQKEAPEQTLPAATAPSAEITSETPTSVSPLLPGVSPLSQQPLPEGTSLSWTCVVCSKRIGADDRHVLVCCGYGLLHKACTTTFVHSQTPCPKCSRLVSSSMQVFV